MRAPHDAGSSGLPGRLPVVAVPGLGLSAAVPRFTLDRLTHPSTVVELPAYDGPLDLEHATAG